MHKFVGTRTCHAHVSNFSTIVCMNTTIRYNFTIIIKLSPSLLFMNTKLLQMGEAHYANMLVKSYVKKSGIHCLIEKGYYYFPSLLVS